MRKFIILLLLGLIGFTGWKVYDKIISPTAQVRNHRQRPDVPVEIASIKTGTVRDIGSFTGSLKPRSRFVVSPKITGRIEKIFVNIGDPLSPKQLIARLDNDESLERLSQAKALLDVAKTNLSATRDAYDFTEKEYQRIQSLRDRNLVSDSELDTIKAKQTEQKFRLRTALAQLKEKEAAVEVARIQLSYTEMRIQWQESNADLVVGERFMDEGALITPNGQLISVIDISTLIAEISVTEKDYFKCHPGQSVVIEADALKGELFEGHITRISPLIQESSREALVEVEIDNGAKRLKPGLFVRASIQFEERQNVTLIPLTALVKRDGTEGVFQVDMNRMIARFVPVQTGIVEGRTVEIIQPSLNGVVVTLGHHLLEDGATVTIPDQDTNASPSNHSLAAVKTAGNGR